MKIKDINPEDIRNRAIKNTFIERHDIKDINIVLNKLLTNAFTWYDTPEGHIFWSKINERL